MEANVMPLVSILASLSLWLVVVLIALYLIGKRKEMVNFAIAGAALVSAILNTATIIGGERSLFLTLIILTLCATAFLHLEEGLRKKRP